MRDAELEPAVFPYTLPSTCLGEVALRQGDYARATRLLEESLALRRQLNNKWGVGVSLGTGGGSGTGTQAPSRHTPPAQSASLPHPPPAQGGQLPPQSTPASSPFLRRCLGRTTRPQWTAVSAEEALTGVHDAELVRIRGRRIDRTDTGSEHVLVLQDGGHGADVTLDGARNAAGRRTAEVVVDRDELDHGDRAGRDAACHATGWRPAERYTACSLSSAQVTTRLLRWRTAMSSFGIYVIGFSYPVVPKTGQLAGTSSLTPRIFSTRRYSGRSAASGAVVSSFLAHRSSLFR